MSQKERDAFVNGWKARSRQGWVSNEQKYAEAAALTEYPDETPAPAGIITFDEREGVTLDDLRKIPEPIPVPPEAARRSVRFRCRIHNWIKNREVHHDETGGFWHYTDDNEKCEVEVVDDGSAGGGK
jgi:hypothetical protein